MWHVFTHEMFKYCHRIYRKITLQRNLNLIKPSMAGCALTIIIEKILALRKAKTVKFKPFVQRP